MATKVMAAASNAQLGVRGAARNDERADRHSIAPAGAPAFVETWVSTVMPPGNGDAAGGQARARRSRRHRADAAAPMAGDPSPPNTIGSGAESLSFGTLGCTTPSSDSAALIGNSSRR